MSKTNKVVLVVSAIALFCLIGVAIVIGVFFSRGSDFADFNNIFGRNMTEINETEDFSLDSATVLAIDCDAANIEFVDADEAKVTITGGILGAKDTDDLLDVYQEGGVLHIDSKREQLFWNVSTGLEMTVYIPSDSMLDLRVDCSSGNIVIDEMQFGDMRIEKSSGGARISECTAQAMEIDSSSGSTIVENCGLGSLDIESSSGNVKISDTTGDITVRSSSGGVTVVGAQAAIDIEVSSGGVSVDYANADISPITISVSSGGIELYLARQAAFDLEAKVTSGNIDTDMEIMVSGKLGKEIVSDSVSGECNGGGELVSLKTTSGNIRILKK